MRIRIIQVGGGGGVFKEAKNENIVQLIHY